MELPGGIDPIETERDVNPGDPGVRLAQMSLVLSNPAEYSTPSDVLERTVACLKWYTHWQDHHCVGRIITVQRQRDQIQFFRSSQIFTEWVNSPYPKTVAANSGQ